jgi:flavin reductase (DIM6/NTAB) family NADH-FMN oxidoreductase RutF
MSGMDPDAFRAVLGRFASGVTVITALSPKGRDHGMTVSAFCSLSLEPPLILTCIGHAASMHDMLVECEHFVVNILAAGQEAVARRFAGPDPDRFEGIGFTRGRTGIALLEDSLAHIECRRGATYPGGDHTIITGEVIHASVRPDRPLLYYRGGYAQLER